MNVYNNGTGLTNNYLTSRHYDQYFTDRFDDFKTTDDRAVPPNTYRGVLDNTLERTVISDIFFSDKNIEYLQNMMRAETKRYTGVSIGKQSENELLIIMRSIYLQYCDNDVANYKKTVSYLNQQVLFDAVPRIIARVTQYIDYMRDAGTGRTFMNRAENVNVTGTKANGGYDRFNL